MECEASVYKSHLKKKEEGRYPVSKDNSSISSTEILPFSKSMLYALSYQQILIDFFCNHQHIFYLKASLLISLIFISLLILVLVSLIMNKINLLLKSLILKMCLKVQICIAKIADDSLLDILLKKQSQNICLIIL